jgi:O-antigen ligase
MDKYINRTAPTQYVGSETRLATPEFDRYYPIKVITFLFLHVLLAYAFDWSPVLATAHALAVLAIGFFWVLADHQPHRVIYILAYIAGSEVLWRSRNAAVFWEYGKYAAILLMLFAILKQRRLAQADKSPLVYFVVLLPSILVLTSFDREQIAFNLSGPLSLAVAIMFFSTVKFTQAQLRNTFVALLGPVVALGVLAAISVVNVDFLAYTGSDPDLTAAGYGANQVSSALGFGAFFAFLFIFLLRKHNILRVLMTGISLWLLIQTAFTFSRGGFWAALGAILVAFYLLLRDRRARTLSLIGAILIVFLLSYVVLPAVDNYSAGHISSRFTDFDPTGRDKILQGDMLAFREHPLAGVGPGGAEIYHSVYFRVSSAHTEYTRLIAEHGMLGVIALGYLLVVTLKRFFQRATALNRVVMLSMTAYALLYMSVYGMRLVIPGLLFGIGAATFELDADQVMDRGYQ